MKIVICLLFSLLFHLLALISLASTSYVGHLDFIQCLVSNSTSMQEVIYTPRNSSYASVLEFSLHNLLFATPETPKPLVIVTPMVEPQIQTVLYCSKKHEMEIRVRGGGHDFEGLSYVSQAPFVLLDMINLRSIDVDPVAATAWVQSGATMGELYYAIADKSKTLGFPGGTYGSVGVTGLIGGGGYGVLRRKYGLAADNVIDARILNVNGSILDRKTMGEDLFWAIRGGGPSSFGIILSWKLNLVSVPERVTIFGVSRTLEQNATDIIWRWQTVAPDLPKDAEIRIQAHTIKKDNLGDDTAIVVRIIGSYLGGEDKLLPLMQERFPELNLAHKDCAQVSYIQSVLYFATNSLELPLETLLDRTTFKVPCKVKTDFVTRPISKQGLNRIWEMLLKSDPDTTSLFLTSYGGKMDEISESAIPFPHRAGTLYMVSVMVIPRRDTTKALDWIRSFYSTLTPYVSSPRTAYVNYVDLDLGVNNQSGVTSYTQASKWGKMYYKENFDRLVHVKSKVDPTNFFRHQQSIPPIKRM
ncbi:berberine bridge enzyme-like 18 [Heracleum sosnowskyi]|uniref:Berberine bridge enzyme-like 18 n=1 Tax=Heracleum sosnowskyi TaxID=360622 RepID=A0AAD8GZG3_9APIA|nr:berberine bridge enzyme-like 18 [Heracleum sosnowskyi]